MDLRIQPPRRPSNKDIAGIVGVARMTDKARAHHAGTIGEFVYGDDSGLDRILLEFLETSADAFLRASVERSDDDLTDWILTASGPSEQEIEVFNTHHLGRKPDEAGQKRLRQRAEKYGVDPSTIETVFESIELDDRMSFREVDLSARPPRSPYATSVAGVVGLARMSDKGRAERAGTLNDYIYNCPIDQELTTFLGIDAEAYQDAAWAHPNDLELGAWVSAETSRTEAEIESFNERMRRLGPTDDEQREIFERVRKEVAPDREIAAWFELLDLDDAASYQD